MTVSASELAALSGYTQRHLSRLKDQNVIPPPMSGRWELGATIRALLRHFKEKDSSLGEKIKAVKLEMLERENLADKKQHDNAFLERDYVLKIMSLTMNTLECVPMRFCSEFSPQPGAEARLKALIDEARNQAADAIDNYKH